MTNACIALALTMGTLLLTVVGGMVLLTLGRGLGRLFDWTLWLSMINPTAPILGIGGIALVSILLFLMFYWILIRPERKHP